MPPAELIDLETIDTGKVLYDLEAVRRGNPQRFEMEQLTAIVYVDCDGQLIVGYKDVGLDEFWVRGHMPEHPLMPGTLMCEAAAQLCCFYCHLVELVPDGFVGFAGIEGVRFRGQVRPGDRLILVGKGTKVRRRQTVFDVQGIVGGRMVFYGRIIGVPLASTTGTANQPA